MLVGIAFIAVTFMQNLFAVGPAFDRLTNDFRPFMDTQALATAQQDIDGLAAAGGEIQNGMLPALAQQMGVGTDQLSGMIAQQYPDVAKGLAAIPQITPQFTTLVTTLNDQIPYFDAADAIPTSSLPAASVPWSLLAVGIVTFLIGLWAWFSPRAASAVAMVLGLALIVVPLALNLPHKASYADTLNSNLKPVYNQQLIDSASASLTTLSAMGKQMQGEMLPGLANQLGMSGDQLTGFMAQNFPKTAAALGGFQDSMTRFQGMVTAFSDRLADYETLKPVSLAPIVWMIIVGGALVLLLGFGGFVAARTRT
jgi:uncharacterized protein YidB (DUF937 family)